MAWFALAAGLVAVAGIAAWYVSATRVETPDYRVERADGAIEIRRYPAMVAATVSRPGDRQAAVRAGFGPLARYIFGRDRDGPKIAMIAPVTQAPAEPEAWTIAFLMPAAWERAALPPPNGDVALVDLPAERVAAIRFSGRWTDARFAAHAERLAAWLEANGIAPAGPARYAYYNDPFTPGFLRRNEVMVPLAAD